MDYPQNKPSRREKRAARQKAAAGERLGPIDVTYLGITLLLLAVGLVMLYSASYAFSYNKYGDTQSMIRDQLIFFAVGLAAMLFFTLMDYRVWQKFSLAAMVVALVMLVVVLFLPEINSARRWISLPFGLGTLQPSEIAKFAVILMFSNLLTVHRERIRSPKYGILPFFLILISVSGLLILEPHLSCTILILGIGFSMMFIGGCDMRFLVMIVIVGVGALVLALMMFPDLIPYIMPRLETWRDPFASDYSGAYQVRQSLITVGSGGLFGRGMGNSAQKFSFLPEMHNDYIFAICCEELGFVGAIIILLMFALLLVRGIFIAMRTDDRFGKMMVVGINVQIALQAFLHIAVNINLIPSTGISMPFFSSGGSSLVMLMAEIGIVLSISRRADLKGDRAVIGDKAGAAANGEEEGQPMEEPLGNQ